MPWYCLKDAQFSALNIQAEEVHFGEVHGGQEGVEWQALHVHHSSHRSILPQSAKVAQHPRALAIVVQHPTDCRFFHHLKLNLHWELLGGETHIDRVHPEIAVIRC